MFLAVVSCTTSPSGSSSAGNSSSAISSTASGVIAMPAAITPSTPANLCDQSSVQIKSPGRFGAPSAVTPTNNPGGPYDCLKNFVAQGVGISHFIDTKLSNLAQPKIYAFMTNHIGTKTTLTTNTGEWVFYDVQSNVAGGYYVYYGRSTNWTNFYIDWQPSGTGWKGTAVHYTEPTNTAANSQEGTFVYDSGASFPSLDIVLQMRPANSANISNIHVVILGNPSDNSVTVAANVDYFGTNISTTGAYNFITSWNMVGYAKEGANGGVMAWTKGLYSNNNVSYGGTNIVDTNGVTNRTSTNINTWNMEISNHFHLEYFDTTGITLYAAAYGQAFQLLNGYDSITDFTVTDKNGTLISNFATNFLETNSLVLTGDFVSNLTSYTNYDGVMTNAPAEGDWFKATVTTTLLSNSSTNYLDINLVNAFSNASPLSDVQAILMNIQRTSNVAATNNTLWPLL
jgi:hypothetical protein